MAFTYPLSHPSSGIMKVSVHAVNVAAGGSSPFTGESQVYLFAGEWWEFEVSVALQERAAAEEWITFLLKLNGIYGTFYLNLPATAAPRGSAASAPGTPLVDGGSQTGNALNISGAPNGAVDYLKTGDMIQLGTGTSTRLHKVLADADADSTGDVELSIWPRLRTSPTNGAAVVVANAKALCRLKENDRSWSIDEALIYGGISFSCREAL